MDFCWLLLIFEIFPELLYRLANKRLIKIFTKSANNQSPEAAAEVHLWLIQNASPVEPAEISPRQYNQQNLLFPELLNISIFTLGLLIALAILTEEDLFSLFHKPACNKGFHLLTSYV